jgi:hypothetical protein
MKMELDRRHAAVGMVIIGFLLLGGSGILNISTDDPSRVMDVNDYGTIVMISDGEAFEALDTIIASHGLLVKWEATVATSNIDAWLYTDAGVNIEKGVHTQDGRVHSFSFTLEGAPNGITEFHVGFGGQYSQDKAWVGSTPHFFVEQDSTPSYPAPEFVTVPEDTSAIVGETINLRWWLIYTGPAIARITVDGVTKASRSLTQTTSEQPITYIASFSDAGVHKIKLIIEPEYDIAYANEVTITVTEPEIPTTTITTTPTTTPPTTPTGTTEVPEEFDLIGTIFGAAILIGVVMVIAIIQIKSRD